MTSELFYLVRFGIVFALLTAALAAPAPEEGPWWHQPCTANPVHHTRHSRSATDTLVEVKRQLRVFIKQLNFSILRVTRLYPKQAADHNKPYAKLKWLNIKRMLKELKKKKGQGGEKMLQQFYKSLQHFAGTLQVLNDQEINTNAAPNFDKEGRKKIYSSITFQMRNLLCEVWESSQNKQNLNKVSLKEMNIPELPKTLDLTGAHILDLNFFKKTKNFIKKSQNLFITKKKTKNSKSAVKQKRT